MSGTKSEETKRKISKALIGKVRPDHVKKKISETLTGYKQTFEHKQARWGK